MAVERYTDLFSVMSNTPLAARLSSAVRDAAREVRRRPTSYLRSAFMPVGLGTWLPVRLGRQLTAALRMLVGHPVAFVKGALATDEVGRRRRRRFLPLLAVSAVLHVALISYLIYTAVLAPFMGLQIVDMPYRPLDEAVMLKPLPNPGRPPKPAVAKQAMTLEQIQERQRKRREEAERKEKERAERERLAKEKAEREQAEKEAERAKAEQARAEADKGEKAGSGEPLPAPKIGQINEAPLRDIIGKSYEKYKVGEIDLTEMNFVVEATFKIEPDGTFSNVKLTRSSGSQLIDRDARDILHAISESRALGAFAHLSSTSIRFELNDSVARLTATSFAPSASEATNQVATLKLLLWGATLAQENPQTKELLSIIKLKSDSKRIDAEMMVSRARASEMMRASFGGGPK